MPNTATMLASDVMDAAASLLNDTAKSTYTYTIQIPYLNMALRDLQEMFELNNIPVTDETSAVINVPAGVDFIGFAPDPPIVLTPYLPDDLIEPKLLWERAEGVNPYTPMARVERLDLSNSGIEINQFINYTWAHQEIRFLAANQDNDIKMNYIRTIFPTVAAFDDELNVVNALSYLQYRTAALVAKYVEENDNRFSSLNGEAINASDKVLGIGTKGRQRITYRHRPFRAGYKSRSYL